MSSGANLPSLGSFNRSVVLDAIRRAPGGISRVEVAALTSLSAQTVSNVTRQLIDDALIHQTGTTSGGVGKPRSVLEIHPAGGYAIGVHIDPSVITSVLLDLAGTVVAHVQSPPPDDPDGAVSDIAAAVDALLASSGVAREKVFGVGIATPGPIDTETGVVVDPPLMPRWRNVPVREMVSRATDLPVLFDKDVNAAAVAHLWDRASPAHPNFAFFYLGTGTGLGVVLRGEVNRGASGNGGDSGSLLVDDGRGPARLGPTVLPWHVLGETARPATQADAIALRARFAQMSERARADDATAIESLDRAAHAIASALVSVINLLDIDQVIFGGAYWPPVADYLLPRIPPLVLGDRERVGHRALSFASTHLGDDVAAIGAASLVLDSAISPRAELLLI